MMAVVLQELLTALFILAWIGTAANDSSPLPIALVYDDATYFRNLVSMGLVDGLVDLVPCDAPDYCGSLENGVRQRVFAVIGQVKSNDLLGQLPQLRLVQSTSYTYPLLSDVPPQAIVASYQPDWRDVYGVEPIAEFILAAIFDWNYKLGERSAKFSTCAWGPDAPMRCPSVQQLTAHPVLMNQTMGVLGYGKIGQAVARRSAAMGMRTVATKVHGPFVPHPQPLAWLSDDNDQLLRESDFVALTLPGSVHGVINKTSLRIMKPGAVVIPISGGTADFDALYDALVHREIGGAVLDVWPHGCWHFPDTNCGPPYGSPTEPYNNTRGQLQQLDNVVALPGMAMRDNRFWSGSAKWVSDNLRAFVQGLPLRGIVRNATGDVLLHSQLRGDVAV